MSIRIFGLRLSCVHNECVGNTLPLDCSSDIDAAWNLDLSKAVVAFIGRASGRRH